jgi:glycosyltransferase involved in cell wall biosynthesis
MRVLHIVPSFYPAHVYGGPIQSVYALCRHLARNGCEVKVLTTNANGRRAVLDVETRRGVELAPGVEVRYCSRLRPESISPQLLGALPGYLRWADVVHLTAVYNFPTIPSLAAAKLLRKPIIWSPRGALQRWHGSTRLRAKSAWERVCRIAAPAGMALHVTSDQEASESLEKLPGFRAAVIPNAVEIPESPVRFPSDGALRLLFLGRLHPKKGIENLLEACRLLPFAWSLVIAGTGEPAYVETLRRKTGALALEDRVTMAGEVVGKAKEEAFGRASLMVAPSYTENFGMVVAEALAHGVPVIAGRGMPWQRVEEIGCGLWVDNDPAVLADSIARLSREDLPAMGRAGRLWMEREFSWDAVAKRMIELYRSQYSASTARRAGAAMRGAPAEGRP